MQDPWQIYANRNIIDWLVDTLWQHREIPSVKAIQNVTDLNIQD